MDDAFFLPWMLRADARDDAQPALLVDLDSWPDGLSFQPLPAVPLIGIGRPDHPQAGGLDMLADDDIASALLLARIARRPLAAAATVQLLRSIETLPPDAALTCESLTFAMLQGGEEHRSWLATRSPTPPEIPGKVQVDRRDATIDVLLNRPDARNAIDRSMRDQLFEAFTAAALDPEIERVRIRGAGRCFSVGADLSEFGTTGDPPRAHAIRMRTLPARALIRRPDIYEVHVQGACVGSGLELAAFARRLTASADAWFQLPETGMGILPGAGGCVSLSRRIGRQRAAALILSGKRIGAKTALRWGLIDAVMDDVPGDEGPRDAIGA
jgi:enoyl-CoA hydratase